MLGKKPIQREGGWGGGLSAKVSTRLSGVEWDGPTLYYIPNKEAEPTVRVGRSHVRNVFLVNFLSLASLLECHHHVQFFFRLSPTAPRALGEPERK
jgi:hypothetical protein